VAELQRGRWTHEHDGGLAVFLIGMRVNRPWRPDLWAPVFSAMPRMLAELHREPSWGFLGHRVLLGAGGPTVVQYWRSVEHVHAYASDPAGAHRPAWSAFNRAARAAAGAVGIWHETFEVQAGAAETIYADVPVMGLAAATAAVPVTAATTTARQRLRRRAG
jgi:Domain of unknown function (DUF4188)